MNDPVELRIPTPIGELTALQWGSAAAPPLVTLHGWLDNAASFARLAPLLAERHRVIALDLPGHGHSAHLPVAARRYHFIDQIDVVLDVADALQLDRFDLLGHSLGAGVATFTAAAAPARLGKLALIEGLGPLADDGSKTLARLVDTYASRGQPRRPPRAFAALDDAITARVAAGGLDAAEARPIVERNLVTTDGGFAWRSDPRLRRTTPVRIAESQVRSLLGGIQAPTLLLLAKPATPYLPAALMQARAACVADLRVAYLDGPHHLHIHAPDAVAQALSTFLDDTP